MDPEKQKKIASKGGKAAHAKGRAHEWTVEEAREAGRKGGAASHRQPPEGQPDADEQDRNDTLRTQPSQAEG
jgi:general stress protein YciG